MSTINVLDKKVYNRISAGEVVERPASVVKELIENSIDAGANKIEVTVKGSGIDYISVKDNGKGLERKELHKIFLPHATSKIEKAEDLDSILTLGFRGEALASIGAIAFCSFTSRPEGQEIGACINCTGGEIGEVIDAPFYEGSEFVCTDLFYNTPVRKKFLKTDKSEENEIITTVSKVALSRPDIAFTLTCDGKTVVETFGGGLKECIASLYGNKTVENCYEIDAIKNGIRVSGFVGKLSFTKPTRAFQTLIVNGRYVVDNTVSSAVANAYGGYLMKRQYPFYVLNLEIPVEAVDVNVHPRKAEVRFSNNQIVYSAVYSTVSKVLDGSSSALEIIKETENSFTAFESDYKANSQTVVSDTENAFENAKTAIYQGELPFAEVGASTQDEKVDKTVEMPKKLGGAFDYNPLKQGNSYASNKPQISVADSGYASTDFVDNNQGVDIFAENKKYIERLEREKALKAMAFKQQEIEVEPTMRYIGQAFLTYLIFEYGNELYLIDQHAAHERLLYDELYEKAKSGGMESQSLLLPYVFTVSREDFDSIYHRFEHFRALGIEIDILRDDSFKVSSIPITLADMNLKEFFDDLIYDDSFKKESVPLALKEKLMQKACKHAIKGGDSLDLTEIDALMAKLKGNFALRCPHGRPIAVKITKAEIEKWFKRTV